MQKFDRFVVGLMLCFFIGAIPSLAIGSEQKRPNVIILMTDDQGYGDLGCYGNPFIKTPEMDKLHKDSVRLTDFHVNSTCSPTRAALITGLYSHRVGVWHTTSSRDLLSDAVPTMANIFQKAGYRTGHFAKWHLGGNYPYRPFDRGFDLSVSAGNGGIGMTDDHWGNDRVNDIITRNGKPEQSKGFSDDVFFDEAMKFIRKEKEKPFFIYLPTYIPHNSRTIPDKKWIDPYRGYIAQKKLSLHDAYFYASIARIDYNLGRLRRFLKDEKIADNTIFIFLTDNGSNTFRVFNAGMKSGKGSNNEGGHRVPCFIHWPKGGLQGGKDIDALTAHIDLFPTLVDYCQLTLPKKMKLDGHSLKPLLTGDKKKWPTSRTLFVGQHRKATPKYSDRSVAMQGKWRLLDGKKLYNMTNDLAQKKDVSKQHPKLVAELRAAYEAHWKDVSVNDGPYESAIAGTAFQKEIALSVIESIPNGKSRQEYVLNGTRVQCTWPIRIAKTGQYRVELRRWPRELNAPILGGPNFKKKKIDAYLDDKPITNLSFGGQPKTKIFEAAEIQLTIGKVVKKAKINNTQTEQTFIVDLPAGATQLNGALIDNQGKQIHGGVYYVYIRPVNEAKKGTVQKPIPKK